MHSLFFLLNIRQSSVASFILCLFFSFSLSTVDGFMFLLIGTALYNNLFDLSFLPCLREPSNERNAENSQTETQAEEATHGTEDERAPLLKQKVEIVPQY